MNKKKGFSIHEYLVVIIMLLVACLLTYIVPAGAYAREEVDGVTKVIADQFAFTAQTPVSPLKLFNYMYEGFVKQAALIFTMFFIAGGVQMIIDTDAIHAVMKMLVTRFSKAPRITIIVMMIAFGIMSVPIQMNYFIPFSGVVLMLCLMMGYDALTAAAIIITSSSFGSTCGMLNISTTAIGNKLADLPIYHGMGFRWIGFVCMEILTTWLIIRYAEKVRKDPSKSIMAGVESTQKTESVEALPDFTNRSFLCIAALVIGVIALIIGCSKFEWSYEETAVCFLITGIVAQLFAGKNANGMCKSFIAGVKTIVSACCMIGLASSIAIVMSKGNILDTVVFYSAKALGQLPPILQGPGMFIAHTVINFFVTSGSGQANITMPVFLPVADLIGMSRETAILALNYGDGLSNYIYPHSSSLMAFLAACGVGYGSWMKWMGKTFIVWFSFACLFMMLAVAVGYC